MIETAHKLREIVHQKLDELYITIAEPNWKLFGFYHIDIFSKCGKKHFAIIQFRDGSDFHLYFSSDKCDEDFEGSFPDIISLADKVSDKFSRDLL